MPLKNVWVIAGLLAFLGGSLFPIIVSPMMNPKKWQDLQKETRKGIKQEEIQPGGMKVWSDPFERKKD
ncbi:small integral membrane protein 20-like isoform X2 [Glandiceps talaboti]